MGRSVRPPRRLLVFLTCLLAVPTVSYILYHTPAQMTREALAPYLLMGAVLGAAHLILRPLLRLLTAPLGCLTLGLSGTCIDVALIYLSAHLSHSLPAPSFLYAILTALLINAITAFVGARR